MKQISILSLILVFSAGSSFGMEGMNNHSVIQRAKIDQHGPSFNNPAKVIYVNNASKSSSVPEAITNGALGGVERGVSEVTGAAIGHIVIETVKGTYHFFVPDPSQEISKAGEQLKHRMLYRQLADQYLQSLNGNPFVAQEEYQKIKLAHLSHTPSEQTLLTKLILAHDIGIKQAELKEIADELRVQDDAEYAEKLNDLYKQRSKEYKELVEAYVTPGTKTPHEEQVIRDRMKLATGAAAGVVTTAGIVYAIKAYSGRSAD